MIQIVASVASLAVLLGVFWAVSFAAPATIEQRLYVSSDGVTPFDSTTWDGVNNSSSQGTDASSNNGVVRVQDTVTYILEQGINDADSDNVTSTVVLTGGQSLSSMPEQCLTEGVAPVSSLSSDKKTLVCNTGSHKQGSKLSVAIKTTVDTAQNGDNISATVSTTSDTTNPTAQSPTPNILVTADYGIDIINELARDSSNNVRAIYGANGPNGEDGVLIPNNITVRVNKYSELPAHTNGIGIQNLLYGVTEYGPGLPQNWRLADWLNGGACVSITGSINLTCTQTGAGSDINILAEDIDYNNSAEPSSVLYKFTVYIWIPQSDAAAAPGMSLTYRSRIDLTPVPLSQSGLTSNGAGTETVTTNNETEGGVLAIPPGGYCSSITFSGNTNIGCGGSKSGTTTTTVGKKVFNDNATRTKKIRDATKNSLYMSSRFLSHSSFLGKEITNCLKIDHRYFDYIRPATISETGHPGVDPSAEHIYIQGTELATGVSHGNHYWQTAHGNPTLPKQAVLPEAIIEYSTTGIGTSDSNLQNAKCDNATANDWSETQPNDPSQITMIRIRYEIPEDMEVFRSMSLTARFTYKMRSDINPPAGTRAPAYGHLATTTGGANVVYDATQDGIYNYDMGLNTTAPDYTDNSLSSYAFNNFNIDRLNFVQAQMDVFKSLVDPDQDIEPGSTVSYSVRPAITGSPTAVSGVIFTIEDKLPTHANIDQVASYVENSTVIEGSNGTYTSAEPSVGPCDTDPSSQCLKWELNNVTPNEEIARINYNLMVSDQLLSAEGANAFKNEVSITSNSTTINSLSDSNATLNGIQRPKDSVTLTRSTVGAYHVYKTDDLQEYPVNSPDNDENYPIFTLHYENASGISLGRGAIIDVLPYNGDSSHDNPRENTFDASTSHASRFTDTSDKHSPGLAAIPSLPAGATIEYVVYEAANSASHPENIASDPCDAANLPSGFDPLTDPSHYCHLLRWNGGSGDGQLIGGGTTGNGETPWTSTEPNDLNDVVAIRINTQSLLSGVASQPISYQIRPTGNKPGDIYCNNFSSRVPEISLEVRSNTVCARVIGEEEMPLADTGSPVSVWATTAGAAILVGGMSVYRLRREN